LYIWWNLEPKNIIYTETAVNNNAKKLLNKKHADQPIFKLPGYIRDTIQKMTDDYSSIF
jgi:hypothetical protein